MLSERDAAEGLLQAVILFDPLIAEHQRASAELAERVGRTMALPKELVERCALSSLLHDVGKFGMDRVILSQPSMLGDAEWDVVMQHSILGERLVSRIPALLPIAPIIRSHHERFDGSGYPDALAGCEIPIEARIIAVVDAFHTMSMPQSYRDRFGSERAVEELLGNRGSQFDPQIVDAMLSALAYRPRRRVAVGL